MKKIFPEFIEGNIFKQILPIREQEKWKISAEKSIDVFCGEQRIRAEKQDKASVPSPITSPC